MRTIEEIRSSLPAKVFFKCKGYDGHDCDFQIEKVRKTPHRCTPCKKEHHRIKKLKNRKIRAEKRKAEDQSGIYYSESSLGLPPNVPFKAVEYWASRGVEVDPYGPPLVNGLPAGFQKVSYRKGKIRSNAISYEKVIPKKTKRQSTTYFPPIEFSNSPEPNSKLAKDMRVLDFNPFDLAGSEAYLSKNVSADFTPARVRKIAELVCYYHGYTVDELRGTRRFKRLCMARQQAYWYMFEKAGVSYSEISRYFHNRCHTTIMHGHKAHGKRVLLAGSKNQELEDA